MQVITTADTPLARFIGRPLAEAQDENWIDHYPVVEAVAFDGTAYVVGQPVAGPAR